MIDDPIVDEVRRYRQENAAKFGYDVRAIAEDARTREKTSGHRIVNLQEMDKRPKPARKPRKPAHLRPDCERGPTLR